MSSACKRDVQHLENFYYLIYLFIYLYLHIEVQDLEQIGPLHWC